ncbi:MAG: BamA/TamA family outer membrane protein, partial [Muribaculaceae bacterium]|nr:BamA/TamA family outer membrane protein [Muribaculaceae bacterium]
VALKLDVTTGQLYKVGAEGYTIFKHDLYRLNYDIYFYSFKDKFWGIGYKNAINDANETLYRRLQAQIRADLLFQLKPNLFLGPLAQFSYVNATRMSRPELLDGQALRTFTTGLGLSFVYDTRDFPLNAYKGVYVRFDQLFNPKFLGNKYAFSQSELTLCGYGQIWKNGVLASMLHANLTYGNTPWGLMPTFGGSGNMRGYYEGRFRDKNAVDITFELRQRVWRRNGIVLWVGAGSIFSEFSDFKWNHVLPNAGIGYRWEFKKRINVRLDYGVGKHQSGINFSINEAF